MKLYRVSIGHTEVFAAGVDSEDIYNRRESLDHTFAYLPIVIDEVTLEGYDIIVSAKAVSNPNNLIDYVKGMKKDDLKLWLSNHDIKYHHTLGEEKLRELALANA